MIAFAVCGCKTRTSEQYVIRDRVNGDYWTGTNWWIRDNAITLSRRDAESSLRSMRRSEVGGYGAWPSEQPIVMEPAQ